MVSLVLVSIDENSACDGTGVTEEPAANTEVEGSTIALPEPPARDTPAGL